MGLPEVWPHQPLGPGERVEEELLGGVVLVDGPPVVFPEEGEEAGALVLPDCRPAVAVHHDLVAGTRAAQGGQEGGGSGMHQLGKGKAPSLADVRH